MKYQLCYDAPVGKRPDGTFVMRTGKQDIDADTAFGVCEDMNLIYGNDTHWIENERGERIKNEDR